MLELRAPMARVSVDEVHGGRLASFQIRGFELLVTESPDPMGWGSYPMIPWAGRIRRGRFGFRGGDYQLPINMAPHSIHGTCFTRRWDVNPDGSLAIDLGSSWPFGGHAIQRFALTASSLTCTIEVHNDIRSMPASVGWHPWFRRPVSLSFAAGAMYVRDHDYIPTGELISPTPGPWDDCFAEVSTPPRLTWPGGPTITLTSTADHWVVYDQPSHALCVEPQTGPPDAFNLAPQLVEPSHPLIATMTYTWG
jgi:aldose 1-epimerase